MTEHASTADLFADLARVDPAIAEVVRQEDDRQRQTIELIASENFPSPAVLAPMSSVLNNKYAEGYPGKRYYGGCEFVDQSESLAIERALEAFGAEHANVQPHSGATANMTAYFSVADPGDTLMGMNLAHGGHLTHGHPVSFSGRFFRVVQYGVREDDSLIDYDELDRLANEHRPKILVAGASAYPRLIDFPRLRQTADRVGATLIVDMAHIAGLVAAGHHPSPVPYADITTSTTHKTLRGPRGGFIVCRKENAAAIDKTNFPGMQGGPLEHVIAAKAVCFQEALTPAFRHYQKQVIKNARVLADALMERGFDLVSGGTDNHLILIDLRSKKITGKRAEKALERARITVNKNAIPFDPEKPFVTSGIRLGTAAVTTRGMKEEEMRAIAAWMGRVMEDPQNEETAQRVRTEVESMTAGFPLHAPPESFLTSASA